MTTTSTPKTEYTSAEAKAWRGALVHYEQTMPPPVVNTFGAKAGRQPGWHKREPVDV